MWAHAHHAPLHFIAFDIDCHKLFGLVNFNWITCFVCFDLIEHKKKSLDRIQGHDSLAAIKINNLFVTRTYTHCLRSRVKEKRRERERESKTWHALKANGTQTKNVVLRKESKQHFQSLMPFHLAWPHSILLSRRPNEPLLSNHGKKGLFKQYINDDGNDVWIDFANPSM